MILISVQVHLETKADVQAQIHYFLQHIYKLTDITNGSGDRVGTTSIYKNQS